VRCIHCSVHTGRIVSYYRQLRQRASCALHASTVVAIIWHIIYVNLFIYIMCVYAYTYFRAVVGNTGRDVWLFELIINLPPCLEPHPRPFFPKRANRHDMRTYIIIIRTLCHVCDDVIRFITYRVCCLKPYNHYLLYYL